jgi:DNA-directed RNA polymerase subunit E'/Rpb7
MGILLQKNVGRMVRGKQMLLLLRLNLLMKMMRKNPLAPPLNATERRKGRRVNEGLNVRVRIEQKKVMKKTLKVSAVEKIILQKVQKILQKVQKILLS